MLFVCSNARETNEFISNKQTNKQYDVSFSKDTNVSATQQTRRTLIFFSNRYSYIYQQKLCISNQLLFVQFSFTFFFPPCNFCCSTNWHKIFILQGLYFSGVYSLKFLIFQKKERLCKIHRSIEGSRKTNSTNQNWFSWCYTSRSTFFYLNNIYEYIWNFVNCIYLATPGQNVNSNKFSKKKATLTNRN